MTTVLASAVLVHKSAAAVAASSALAAPSAVDSYTTWKLRLDDAAAVFGRFTALEEQHMGSGRQQAGGCQHSSPRRRAECIGLVPAAARASLAASLPASPERPRPTSAPAQHDLEELQRRLAAEQERTTKATAHESGAQVGAQPRGLAAAAPKRRAVSPPQQQQQQQQHARMYASAPYTPPPPIQPPLSPGLHGCGVWTPQHRSPPQMHAGVRAIRLHWQSSDWQHRSPPLHNSVNIQAGADGEALCAAAMAQTQSDKRIAPSLMQHSLQPSPSPALLHSSAYAFPLPPPPPPTPPPMQPPHPLQPQPPHARQPPSLSRKSPLTARIPSPTPRQSIPPSVGEDGEHDLAPWLKMVAWQSPRDSPTPDGEGMY